MLVSVKQKIKKIIKQMPGVRSILFRLDALQDELQNLSFENQLLANKNIDLRLKLKKINGEKVNVVFVCHRPAVWESLHSVYDALEKDDLFKVTIVAIPNKKQLPDKGLNHEVYESEGAEEFWESYGCVNGYNYETHEWLDLQSLEPDYVFFQQPYNGTRCNQYKSWVVSKYAKICYLNYFSPVSFGKIYEECMPQEFMKDLSFYFTQHEQDHQFVLEEYKGFGHTCTDIIMTGYPRYDNFERYRNASERIWKDKDHTRFRIVWTPRWTTNEGNCHFFDYKDKFIEFCRNENVEFVFRPHPQAFLEWNATGELLEEDAKEYRKKYEENMYMHIDESKSYMDMLYSSDCLITDPSSIMYDYFLTGKPIILCTSNGKNDTVELLNEGLYKANTWEEICYNLELLMCGKDSLIEKRENIIKHNFYYNPIGAGENIKIIIKKDALK